jgi:hypothetical protein
LQRHIFVSREKRQGERGRERVRERVRKRENERERHGEEREARDHTLNRNLITSQALALAFRGDEIPQALFRRSALDMKFYAPIPGFLRLREHRQRLSPALALKFVLGDAIFD